jgi:hypothetical protein
MVATRWTTLSTGEPHPPRPAQPHPREQERWCGQLHHMVVIKPVPQGAGILSDLSRLNIYHRLFSSFT